jgi:predicted nucleotidyltransferase
MSSVEEDLAERATAALRAAGAVFALVHGSRARGTNRQDSDLDVAAWWPTAGGGRAPASFEVDLAPGVDLLVLNGAPLELAGRVSVEGVLLFDDDPPARVRWVATTRKIWFDERPRFERAHREFLEAVSRGR